MTEIGLILLGLLLIGGLPIGLFFLLMSEREAIKREKKVLFGYGIILDFVFVLLSVAIYYALISFAGKNDNYIFHAIALSGTIILLVSFAKSQLKTKESITETKKEEAKVDSAFKIDTPKKYDGERMEAPSFDEIPGELEYELNKFKGKTKPKEFESLIKEKPTAEEIKPMIKEKSKIIDEKPKPMIKEKPKETKPGLFAKLFGGTQKAPEETKPIIQNRPEEMITEKPEKKEIKNAILNNSLNAIKRKPKEEEPRRFEWPVKKEEKPVEKEKTEPIKPAETKEKTKEIKFQEETENELQKFKKIIEGNKPEIKEKEAQAAKSLINEKPRNEVTLFPEDKELSSFKKQMIKAQEEAKKEAEPKDKEKALKEIVDRLKKKIKEGDN